MKEAFDTKMIELIGQIGQFFTISPGSGHYFIGLKEHVKASGVNIDYCSKQHCYVIRTNPVVTDSEKVAAINKDPQQLSLIVSLLNQYEFLQKLKPTVENIDTEFNGVKGQISFALVQVKQPGIESTALRYSHTQLKTALDTKYAGINQRINSIAIDMQEQAQMFKSESLDVVEFMGQLKTVLQTEYDNEALRIQEYKQLVEGKKQEEHEKQREKSKQDEIARRIERIMKIKKIADDILVLLANKDAFLAKDHIRESDFQVMHHLFLYIQQMAGVMCDKSRFGYQSVQLNHEHISRLMALGLEKIQGFGVDIDPQAINSIQYKIKDSDHGDLNLALEVHIKSCAALVDNKAAPIVPVQASDTVLLDLKKERESRFDQSSPAIEDIRLIAEIAQANLEFIEEQQDFITGMHGVNKDMVEFVHDLLTLTCVTANSMLQEARFTPEQDQTNAKTVSGLMALSLEKMKGLKTAITISEPMKDKMDKLARDEIRQSTTTKTPGNVHRALAGKVNAVKVLTDKHGQPLLKESSLIDKILLKLATLLKIKVSHKSGLAKAKVSRAIKRVSMWGSPTPKKRQRLSPVEQVCLKM